MGYLSIGGSTGQIVLSFSQLMTRGEVTPLRGLRGVRNADDWSVEPQIGHSAVKRLDDSIQTELNVRTEQLQHRLFNLKRSITNVSWNLTDWITCCTR